MHSSRMRTGRSLTVCRSLLPGGDVSAPGGMCLLPGGFCSGGVSAPGGVCSWGCLLPGGVSAPRGGVCSGGCLLPRGSAPRGGWYPAFTKADTPPVNRMTDRCKNITLATTSLRQVINFCFVFKILRAKVLTTNQFTYIFTTRKRSCRKV